MKRLGNRVLMMVYDERGAALAEWGLLVTLIAIVALVAVQVSGAEVSETYSEITSALVEAGA